MALNLGTLVGFLKIDDSDYNRKLDSADSKGRSWAAGMGRYGKLAAAGIGAATGGAVLFGVKTAAANEQAEIAFTTMLGSAEKAGAFLKDLQSFAAKTPFEFPELQQAASNLISAGFEAKNVIPIMTTLGDVTSGMGTGSEGVKRATIALQQMQAAGRITAEDLNQLRDAGIPVYDLLAKATGRSKEEVVKLAAAGKLGKKDLDAMMDALASGKGLERFSGLMDKQSESLSGMWSTFKDVFGQKMATAIQPLIPLMKDGLGGATEFIGTAIGGVATGIGFMITAFQTAHGVISAVVGFIKANQTVFTVLAIIIGTLLTPAIILWGVQATIAAAKNVAAWLITKASAIASAAVQVGVYTLVAVGWAMMGARALAGAARMAAAWLIALGPIGLVIAAIAAIVVVVVKNWDTIKAKTKAAWDWVVAQVKKVPGLIVGFFRNFTLPGLIIKHWDSIKNTVKAGASAVVGFVKELPGKIVRALGNLGNLLINAGKDLMRGLRDGIGAGLKWVRDKVAGLGRFIPGWVKSALGISSPSTVMRDQVGIWIPAGVAEGITKGIPQVEAAARRMSVASSVPQNRLGMTRFGGGSPAAGGGGVERGSVTINQTINTHETQSPRQVGDVSAQRVLFALALSGGTP